MSSEAFGTLASTLDLSKINDVVLPNPAPDGRIRTINNMGYATPDILGTSAEFVEFASHCDKPVLDGGAAYGATTIAALKKGATVIANEMDQKFLDSIVKNKELTDEDRKHLYLKFGKLPRDVDFPENSLGAVHMARVTHFFHPDEIEELFDKIYKWLAPKGRFYVMTSSPYHYATPNFDEIYEKRYKEGDEWPGLINDFQFTIGNEPTNNTPKFLHVIDPRVLFRVATKHGFIVKKIELYGGKLDHDYTCGIFIKP